MAFVNTPKGLVLFPERLLPLLQRPRRRRLFLNIIYPCFIASAFSKPVAVGPGQSAVTVTPVPFYFLRYRFRKAFHKKIWRHNRWTYPALRRTLQRTGSVSCRAPARLCPSKNRGAGGHPSLLADFPQGHLFVRLGEKLLPGAL